MYLIIDIRSKHLEDIATVRYAKNWGKLWQEMHPNDTLIYLIGENQDPPEGARVFRAKNHSLFSPRRRLTIPGSNEVLRCVNFSRYAPYDRSIPTITHVFDMGRWLYDNATNANIFKRKEREYAIRRMLSQSTHIVVPDFATGSELVELWSVAEEKIDILPFIDIERIEESPTILEQLGITEPYFVYDGSYGNESNIFSLLEGFAVYKQEKKGKAMLVLHGNTSHFLSELTDTINTLQLTQHIKITGTLSESEQEALYNHAQGFISLSSYATHKMSLALALSKNVNLLLSKIPQYQLYTHAIKIHPNHLYEIAGALETLEHKEQVIGYPGKVDTPTIMQLYKKLLMSGNKKSVAS